MSDFQMLQSDRKSGATQARPASAVNFQGFGTVAPSAMHTLQRTIGNQALGRLFARKDSLVPPAIERGIEQARSGGQPLRQEVKAQTEKAFDFDFARVRVHSDEAADKLARSVRARAFTVGNHIFLGRGEYDAGGERADKVLAHELTHVVQQSGAERHSLTLGQATDRHEREADATAQMLIKDEARKNPNSISELTQIKNRQDQNVPSLQCWVAPTDWLDYIGLAIDVAERAYIELAYEEGEEKDFQRFVNTLFFCIDLALAALPGAGGGGLAVRASHGAAIAAWGIVPQAVKLTVAEEVAKRMGWHVTKAVQMINRYFAMSTASGHGGAGGGSESGGGEHPPKEPAPQSKSQGEPSRPQDLEPSTPRKADPSRLRKEEPAPTRRSSHSEQRRLEGRRVGPAFNDARGARQSDVFVQPDGRYVVRGPRGREHIFEPDGTLVTSIDRSHAAHLKKLQDQSRAPVATDAFDTFKALFR